MAEKTLKTRIALLYKTYAEWETQKSFVPLKGEFCICEVPAESGSGLNEPAILFKAGDGVKSFEQLPWSSAYAADVFAWAKKENLDFEDLDTTFKTKLEAFVGEHSLSDEYQMIDAGNGVWKLQKKDKDAEEWENVSTVDVAAFINPLLAKKVDKVIEGTNGKAEIFNESDGGGAKFTHNDGSESFVGVNDGGENGLMAQIYADKLVDGKWQGAKLDVTNEGMFYTVGDKSFAERAIADNELAVKGDLKAENVSFVPVSGEKPMTSTDVQSAIEEAWNAIKSGGTGSVVTLEKAQAADEGYFATYIIKQGGNAVAGGVQGKINIPKDFLVKSASIKLGSECVPVQEPQDHKFIDFVINVKEGSAQDEHLFLDVEELAQVYTAGDGINISESNEISVDTAEIATVEYVDDSISDTMNFIIQERDAEKAAREAGDNLLQTAINTEVARAKAEEAKKVDRAITGDKGKAEIFNERDGGGAKFTGTETAFVGVHDSIGGEIGVQAYVDNAAGTESTIIDITQNGAYYTKGEIKPGSERDVDANEIATKGDINAAASAAEEEIERLDGEINAVDAKVDALDESLETIAKTGNVNDLIQTEDDVLILNCNL